MVQGGCDLSLQSAPSPLTPLAQSFTRLLKDTLIHHQTSSHCDPSVHATLKYTEYWGRRTDVYPDPELVLAPVFPIGEKVAEFSGVGVPTSQDDDNVHKGGAVCSHQGFWACGLRRWVGWGSGCFPWLNSGLLGRVGGDVVCRHGW